MENEMVKKYYEQLSSEILIQTILNDLDKLTTEAKEMIMMELNKRNISFDEISLISSLNDSDFFKYLLDNNLSDQGELFKWIEFKKDQKLKPYIDDFSYKTIDSNLKMLWNFKIQVSEEGGLENDYVSLFANFLALQLYLKEQVLNSKQNEIFQLILRSNSFDLNALNQAEEIKKITESEIFDVIAKLNKAGMSIRKIGNYLVRYIIGSIGVSLVFILSILFGKPTLFTLFIPVVFSIMTCILLFLIIGEFLNAGKKLEEIQKRDFDNLI